MNNIVIMWFRLDLRIQDNPALHAAAKAGQVLPLYIVDDEEAGEFKPGSNSQYWLYHSLKSLNEALDNKLLVIKGKAQSVLDALCKKHHVSAIFWNRCYEPWRMQRDTALKSYFQSNDIKVESFNSQLLFEPFKIKNKSGGVYKIFTPFYKKACLPQIDQILNPLKKTKLSLLDYKPNNKLLETFGVNTSELLPEPKTINEKKAHQQLTKFLSEKIADYNRGRDYPAESATSRISAYLHYGQISPRQIVFSLRQYAFDDYEPFLRELIWREFAYYCLYHFNDLPKKAMQEKFRHFPYSNNKQWLTAWQQGKTGYPIVDAGMRELNETGHMHNRVRMITASFLVKNLMWDWRAGAAYFWEKLLDADLASNNASWQWVAGSGTDSAPYFRIFNPVLQGEKFDPDGLYIKHFLPELKNIPKKYCHKPWECPNDILKKLALKVDYPSPIVDLKISRLEALAAYNQIK